MTGATSRQESDRGRTPDRLVLRPLLPGTAQARSREVARMDRALRPVIDEMLEVMRLAGYPSLSAPLLGVRRRLIAIDLTGSGRSQVVLVNPALESVSTERQVDLEGCPALPDVMGRVERPLHVVIVGLTPGGQRIRLHAGGLLARLLQHELDHLDGRSLLDRLRGGERTRVEARLRTGYPRCARLAPFASDASRPPRIRPTAPAS